MLPLNLSIGAEVIQKIGVFTLLVSALEVNLVFVEKQYSGSFCSSIPRCSGQAFLLLPEVFNGSHDAPVTKDLWRGPAKETPEPQGHVLTFAIKPERSLPSHTGPVIAICFNIRNTSVKSSPTVPLLG